MSDLFHDDVPIEFIARVFDVMRETPHYVRLDVRRFSHPVFILTMTAQPAMGVGLLPARTCVSR